MFSAKQAVDWLHGQGLQSMDDQWSAKDPSWVIDKDFGHRNWLTDNFYIRILDDCIQFGYRRHFARWANSVDMVLYKIPSTKGFDLMQFLDWMVTNHLEVFDRCWGRAHEAYPYVRQYLARNRRIKRQLEALLA